MLSLNEIYNLRHERLAVTAHRGASFDYPENTLAAMEQAVQAGADFIEFDLRLTSDGQVVLLHDRSIDRTSDGAGMIEEMTFAAAREFNYSFFHRQLRHEIGLTPPVKIPTFEEVLQQFAGRVAMNIQIYVGGGDG
ncbi:MAG: glycerophosphodiester phosphodiesterase family protein, partial [Victivallaceae bacterium]